MTRKIKLGEQVTAIGIARRVLMGLEKAPSSERQREYVADCLDATEALLKWARDNEAALRELMQSTRATGATPARGTDEAGQ
jgi:hypothetical protein